MDKVAGIILLVEDIERAFTFYETLGFTFMHRKSDIEITVTLGNFQLELLATDKVVTREYKADVGITNKGVGSYLQIQVSDVDVFYKELLERGITIAGQPEDYPWNHREFTVADPDGYKLTFFSKQD